MTTTTTDTPLTAGDRALLIESQAHKFKAARGVLSDRLQALENKVTKAHRRAIPGIKTALAATKQLQDELAASIEQNRDLFEKPQTVTLHGTKYGVAKGRGGIEWEDSDAVIVSRIRKQIPDKADLLIKVTEAPKKKALQDLDAKTLQALGITIKKTGLQVVVKVVDGDTAALVKRLLAESFDRTEEGQQ